MYSNFFLPDDENNSSSVTDVGFFELFSDSFGGSFICKTSAALLFLKFPTKRMDIVAEVEHF